VTLPRDRITSRVRNQNKRLSFRRARSRCALTRLGVELVFEAYERDPEATLARLADIAMRGDEAFQIPPELLVAE